MSNHLISEVYKRQIGGLARNAVMILLADKASDDGSGIWASKQRMADEIGTTRQTIISTIKSLIADGLIEEVGQRKCAQGYTVEYAINVDALRALELVPSHQDNPSSSFTSPVKQLYPTRKAALRHPSSSFTQTIIEPPLNQDSTCPSEDEHALKPDHFVEAWNDMAASLSLPAIRKLTPERRTMLKARINGYSIDEFNEVLANIRNSPFLRGEKNWKGCTFDWVIKKGNFQKILEGNYNG